MNFEQNAFHEVTFDDLPNEVLQHIFSFLNHEDCLAASLVCRRWNCNAFQIRLVALDIRLDSPSFKSTVSTLMASERNYRHLRVSTLGLPPEVFGKYCNCLETFEMSFVEEEDFLYHLYRLKRLEEFNLSGPPYRSLKAIRAHHNEYASFTNFNTFISVIFPALAFLKLEDGIFDTHTQFRLSNLPLLEELEIDTRHIIDCHLLEDFKSLPKLRNVKLRCSELRKMDQIDPDTRLGQVRSLEVAVGYGDVYLLRLVEMFPALTRFVAEAKVEYLVDSVEARKRIPNCHFEVFELKEMN
ncbi:uncharacterized protein LOC120431469 isoform X2 [Culex pipiens pallens]|uniref:uncharacterized protein LOC120431469 isoform X2 n=1 Tax=Culex pipiens pallens TaxID=42434 RepID=UPI0022AA9D8D|nr:uncharacterized protein LOC120431469 isoform X2 [Culex pipiens pallens]